MLTNQTKLNSKTKLLVILDIIHIKSTYIYEEYKGVTLFNFVIQVIILRVKITLKA